MTGSLEKEAGHMMRRTGGFYRKLALGFWLSAIAGGVFVWHLAYRAVPDQISMLENQKEEFSFSLPWRATLSSESAEVSLGNESNIPGDEITVNSSEPFHVFAGKKGSYQMNLKLLGLIKLKEIQVDVVDTRYAIPCGSPIGIYLKSQGVMVVGTGRITREDGRETEPAFGKLKSGDYIETFNGTPLSTKEDLVREVGKWNGGEASLTIRRRGENMEVALSPVKGEDGSYKLGAWVRDDTQGIGTITYVDPNGHFGALGHGISDSDTGELVEIETGALYTAKIMGVEKGEAGKPGLLSGVIYYGPQSCRGEITANTEDGIFGMVDQQLKKQIQGEPMEVARCQEVKPGPAVIRTAVSGEVKDYTVEIQKVDQSPSKRNKAMVLKVTDPELLSLTGGIVQGLSGTPILQNGKLAGAVTHVFVQDPSRGYGILADDMMKYGEE
jgi:stage IV sporulation protein B